MVAKVTLRNPTPAAKAVLFPGLDPVILKPGKTDPWGRGLLVINGLGSVFWNTVSDMSYWM